MNDNQQNSSTIVQLVGDTAHEYSIATSQWSGGQGMTCLTKAVQQALDALATAKTTMLDLYGGWRCQNVIKACEDAHTALLAASKLTQAERHLTVTTNESGEAVLVSWQDDEHRILEVVWERKAQPSPLAGEVTDEQIDDLAWLDVDEHREIDRSSDHNKMMTAPQRCAFKRGACAILALRPQAEIDVRNTPFGKEAEKLAADYLALMSECAGLREQLASLRPQAVPMTPEGEPVGEIVRSFSTGSGLEVKLRSGLTSDTPGIVGTKLFTRPAPGVPEAWDEGYRQGVEDERISEANIGIAGFGAKVSPARQNPYRAAAQAKGRR